MTIQYVALVDQVTTRMTALFVSKKHLIVLSKRTREVQRHVGVPSRMSPPLAKWPNFHLFFSVLKKKFKQYMGWHLSVLLGVTRTRVSGNTPFPYRQFHRRFSSLQVLLQEILQEICLTLGGFSRHGRDFWKCYRFQPSSQHSLGTIEKLISVRSLTSFLHWHSILTFVCTMLLNFKPLLITLSFLDP